MVHLTWDRRPSPDCEECDDGDLNNGQDWSACDKPVLFVRMDASPSRWGRWRQLREPMRAGFTREDPAQD